ncbi:MAG: RNA 2',3'-cyclic phosphodiesterase [Candidatus Bathyarchaeia archaeon]|jgi:2'-5' RNA ligase
MAGSIRTFFAFDIEDETITRLLTKAQGMLASTGADLKMVEPQNIHLTVRFLGDTSPAMVDPIYEEMKQIKFTPIEVELKGLGVFPRLTNPRVVWAGITKGAKELTNVFAQLEPRLRGLVFAPDNKGFSPHLTIARVRTGRNKPQLVKLVQELGNFEFGTAKVSCLRLKKSDLTPRGPIYSNLLEVCAK